MKVTLESESGETVVIEQGADGRVKCEPVKGSKSERAANTAPARGPETRAEAAKPPKAKTEPKRSESAPKAEEAPQTEEATKAKASTKPRNEGKGAAKKARRRAALKWMPVKDHDYDGFAARSDAGQFKVLITKGSQWALFYELKDTWPKNLGCFRKVEQGQKRAQELHDAGWPESEFGPVTAGQIARACPAPAGMEDVETEGAGEMKATRKVEEKPAAPKPTPKTEEKPPPKTEVDQDKELMSSFTSELDTVLDEDEDD